jgi:peptidoglycan/LPS O-acetylase OafA/YrhL
VFFFHSFHTEYSSFKASSIYILVKKDLFGNGNLGVNFFFVLSGFLITWLLVEEKLNGKIHIKNFWIRRILRIWPLYFFCVFFGFVVFPMIKAYFGQASSETADPVYYLTFTNNFDFIRKGLPDASVLGVLWSIAIEEQFYFTWPILLSFLPVKHYIKAFLLIIACSLVFRTVFPGEDIREYHTLSCMGDLTIGALGACLCRGAGFKQCIENMSRSLIVLIYVLFFIVFFFRDEIFNSFFYLKIFERSLIACLILMIILEQNFSKNSFYKMSDYKRISKLGTISYGLYCLHFIGILITITISKKLHLNENLWNVLILETLSALVITILLSRLSFRYFESPFLRVKEKFSYFTK